tara:strand:+ start:918 stop:1706 length:789 start_codon:yes stop_codon:yes gene_type:complete
MENCIFNLDGKTAIITGGCGWLGFKMAQILAQYNANVIITSRDLNNALVAITKLDNSSSKQQHYAIELNINDSEEIIDKKFSELVEIYGKIDILINNAVEFTTKDISNISLDEFNQYQKQNGFNFYLSKLVRDLAVKNDLSSSIVNLGSMYGLVASYPEVYDEEEYSSSIAYHSLKGGLINMTKHMAVYWAKDKIRVNCLSPGAFPKPSINSKLKDKLEEKIPIGNIGNPTQLQGPLLLLVSDAGSYITGHNLVVDGGWTIQ